MVDSLRFEMDPVGRQLLGFQEGAVRNL